MNGSRPSCEGEEGKTPACHKQCESSYDVPYAKDLHYGSKSYSIRSAVPQIQAEIFNNGPVEAAFSVYADFVNYKTGELYVNVTLIYNIYKEANCRIFWNVCYFVFIIL